ncbi:hypothetical protein [Halorientalis pallida]|uniref:Capsule polysaccharide biosynthesis protein n=1 Tax=Halorientalis pallida TaxID=2479928 RepID=A0A498KRC2_9EURY|nr:hypothetical protein [Halorientalis pallida]RXK46932.1 hypothetical protein EAF64_17450 [Halorientalis pallida]
MGYSELYDRFLRIESELDPFSITVDGVPVWERVRLPVFREILQQTGEWGQEVQKVEKSISNLLKGGYLLARNAVYRNPYRADSHDFLFWGFERRKQLEEGHYWDLFCDPLYERLDFDYLHLEEPHLNGHLRPVQTERFRYLDRIEYMSTIKRSLGIASGDIPKPQRTALEALSERFNEEFDVSVDISERASFRLALRASTRSSYRKLLERIDPAMVFVVVSFQKETFVEVCNELDIPVVELQHGILAQYEYGFPGFRTKETFPDYFFSFGEYWNDRVDLPIQDDKIRAIGYGHFDRQRERFSNTTTGDDVVFISQGNVGEKLSKAALELSRHPSIDDSNIVYKLHPGEYGRWQADYPWLRESDLRVVGKSGPDLYELFADAYAQVGVYSTAVYEGLGFGLTTYLYDLPGVEELEDLVTTGYAQLVSSPEELATTLTERQQPRVDSAAFFAPNPHRNFVEAVRDIQTAHDLDLDITLSDGK